MATTKIKAVLFDMDGVLIDARDWHYEALNDALGPMGLNIARDEHLSTYDGLPTKKKLQMLSASRNLPKSLHTFLNDLKQKHTYKRMVTLCKPTFHHLYLLTKLKNEGYKTAMCSNSIRRTVEVMAELADLTRYMDLLLSNEDVAKTKPDPEIYQKAIGALGLKPEECLIVEDNENGIAAARASGAHVLEVGSPDDVTYERVSGAIRAAGK